MIYHVRGFFLVEAIIALVVSSVGLLGIALFTSNMLSESSNSKARQTAISIAQRNIESLRVVAGESEIASIADGNVDWLIDPDGVSFTEGSQRFTISTSVGSITNDSLPVNLKVKWSEKPWEELSSTEYVQLNTIVAKDAFDATDVNGSSGGGLTGGNPYLLNPPSGNAEYGEDAPGGVLPSDIQLDDLLVSQAEGSNEIRLLGKFVSGGVESFKELLVTTTSDGFAEVRGVVFIDNDSGVNPDSSGLVIKPSDTGVCPRGPTIDASEGAFFEYRCFFGAGWYGNIPLFYGDATIDSVVGDPTCDTSSFLYNSVNCESSLLSDRSPKFASNNQRIYRGYTIAFGDDGALFDSDGNLILVAHGLEAGEVYGYGSSDVDKVAGHDFAVFSTAIDPNLAASSASSAVVYDSLLPGVSGPAFDNFVANKGDFVCLETEGATNCPSSLTSVGESVSAANYTISGSVAGASSSDDIRSVTSQFSSGYVTKCFLMEDGGCDAAYSGTFPICTNTASSYECSIYGLSSWDGEVIHEINDSLINDGYEFCSPSGGIQEFSSVSGNLDGQNVVISTECATAEGFCNVTIDSPADSSVIKNKDFNLVFSIENSDEGEVTVSATSHQGEITITDTGATITAPNASGVSFTVSVRNNDGDVSCSAVKTFVTTNN